MIGYIKKYIEIETSRNILGSFHYFNSIRSY